MLRSERVTTATFDDDKENGKKIDNASPPYTHSSHLSLSPPLKKRSEKKQKNKQTFPGAIYTSITKREHNPSQSSILLSSFQLLFSPSLFLPLSLLPSPSLFRILPSHRLKLGSECVVVGDGIHKARFIGGPNRLRALAKLLSLCAVRRSPSTPIHSRLLSGPSVCLRRAAHVCKGIRGFGFIDVYARSRE